MKKIISFNAETKGLAISLIAHIAIIGFFLFEFNQPHKAASQPKVITMDLILPAPSEIVEEPKPIHQPKTLQEEVKKNEPQAKVKEPFIPEKIVKKQEKKTIEKPIKTVTNEATKENIKKEAVVSKAEYKKTNFAIIRDKVLSHLKYPAIAKRMSWSGTATVKLTIDTDGNLINVSLAESSGREQLDNAALSATRAIKGDNLPKPNETTDILLPISFDLR